MKIRSAFSDDVTAARIAGTAYLWQALVSDACVRSLSLSLSVFWPVLRELDMKPFDAFWRVLGTGRSKRQPGMKWDDLEL